MIETIEPKKKVDNRIKIFSIKSGAVTVVITNYGASILNIIYKGKDIVLGHDGIDEYVKYGGYFGATVGRVCNRIENGKFKLNGKEYNLSVNQGNNSLHGGFYGFDRKIFDYKVNNDKLELSYLSKDGEEGYPGNLLFKVTYYVIDNEIHIEYEGVSDADTICNITNHSFFNLNGNGEGEILNHRLLINADYLLPINENRIPTGELMPVENTPFDFRDYVKIGQRINDNHPQLLIASGYDHAFKLNGEGLRKVASAIGDKSNIELEVLTDQKAVQFYCAKYGKPKAGKGGKEYLGYSAFCLETEGFPNAINCANFPSIVLEKGKKYLSQTVFVLK